MSSTIAPATTKDGPLTLTVTDLGTTRAVSLAGELDLSNVDTVAAHLDADAATESFLVDLSELDFIDSSGIALLMDADRRINRDGFERLRIIPSRADSVCRILAMTGVDTRLPFISDRAFAA